ncbi:MAG: cell division protein SepF [Candidatus Asgardarchaeia archaeon]|nr:cell division protein SepF [Candidatus Odinarchaeota archaeon]
MGLKKIWKWRKKKEKEEDGDEKNVPIMFGIVPTVSHEKRATESKKSQQELESKGEIEIVSFDIMGQSYFELNPIEKEILNGNIALVNLESFLNKAYDEREIIRLLDKLRGLAKRVGGDIAQIGETSYLLITPKHVRIRKREEEFINPSS